MKMIKVKSSNIRTIGYSAKLFQLVVEFKATDRSKAKVFTYEDVSPAEYDALINASSVGRHFGAYIKNVKEGSPIHCTIVVGDSGDELHVKGKSKPTTSPWIDARETPVNGHTDWVDGEKAIAIDFESSEPYAFEIEWDDGVWCNIGGEGFTHWIPLPPIPTI